MYFNLRTPPVFCISQASIVVVAAYLLLSHLMNMGCKADPSLIYVNAVKRASKIAGTDSHSLDAVRHQY